MEGLRQRSVLQSSGLLVAAGVAVTLLVWHADTLRLKPGGTNLAWAAIVGAGVGAFAVRRGDRWAWIGSVTGSLVGAFAPYVGLQVLPSGDVGPALALGIGTVILGVLVMAGRFLAPGPVAVGFGVGVAATVAMRIDVATHVSDVFAVWTALALSMVIGVLATVVVSRSGMSDPDQGVPLARPSGEAPTEVLEPVGSVREGEIYGPIIEPPRTTEAPARRRSTTTRPTARRV